MTTIKIKELELPLVPPKNWKKTVAQSAGVSEKTVYNAICRGIRGPQSNKVIGVYANLYGKISKMEVVE